MMQMALQEKKCDKQIFERDGHFHMNETIQGYVSFRMRWSAIRDHNAVDIEAAGLGAVILTWEEAGEAEVASQPL